MYIVMVASECAPVAKVGGLGDVVFGLSGALELAGHTVEIMLPKYDHMRADHVLGLQVSYEDLWVPWGTGAVRCVVWFGLVYGRRCFFIEPHSADHFFDRGAYYGFYDDPARFAFFTKAALEFMLRSGKRPDIVHSHDWQTGLTAVLLFELYQHNGMPDQRVCHTVHNFMHQGVAGEDILWLTGLGRPEHFNSPERLHEDHAPKLNFTKGAIVYANFVTTVSPQYAWEARYTADGYGLGHALYVHQNKFAGVLNGLDYDMWNPETDPHIAVHFNARRIEKKRGDTQALRSRLGLAEAEKPVVASVGRLDKQKGVGLIRHAIFYAIRNEAQFVLLGSSPEQRINDEFLHMKRVLAGNPDCHLEIGFDEELAHLIYAGADMIVVPSLFEPCGLTQMIALRYGTVPIVRAVGGLKDTVFDVDYSPRPVAERNGYVFTHTDHAALESALGRAFALWRDHPAAFRELMRTGMRCDYSWRIPAQNYLDIYEFIRHK